MFLKTYARWSGISLASAVLAGILGCGGVDLVTLKNLEIDELSYVNARQHESLESSLREGEKLGAENEALRSEKTALITENASLGASLRSANEEAGRSTGQRAELSSKITELREANERLTQNLDKVKSVASASVGELADLRLKRQELEDRVQTLSQAHASLSDETSKQGREIAKLTEELTRARAVVRSLQEGGEVADGSSPSDQIERLLAENADLRGEVATLKKRVEILAAPSPGGLNPGASDVELAAAGNLYRQNPEGLLQEFGALLKYRYEKLLKGQIAWDGFDFAFLGFIGLTTLVGIWLVVRWFRLRRLMRHVRALKGRVAELEQGAETSPRGRAQGGRAGQNVRRVRSAAVRRPGFSAVISRQDVSALQEDEEETEKAAAVASPSAALEAEEPRVEEQASEPQSSSEPPHPASPRGEGEDVLERMVHGMDDFMEEHEPVTTAARSSAFAPDGVRGDSVRGDAAGTEPPSAEPRRVIGARSWAAPSESEEGGDLANTEIMQRVTDNDMPPVSLPSLEPKLPEPSSRVAPGASSTSKPSEGGPAKKAPAETDLLAELKAVINKKFDELLK
jgi:hypothetical protein